MSENGKGDKRRPRVVQIELFESSWDKTFKVNEPKVEWCAGSYRSEDEQRNQ